MENNFESLVAGIYKNEKTGTYTVNITIDGIENQDEAVMIAEDISSLMVCEDICYDDNLSTMQ